MIKTISLEWSEFKHYLIENQPEYLGIDTETSGQNPKQGLDIRDGRAYSLGLSLAMRMGETDNYITCYLPKRHNVTPWPGEENLSAEIWVDICKILNEFEGFFIFHNAKFDIVSLSTMGINIYHNNWYDTLLMCHLLNENFPYSKDLSTCVKTYVDKAESKKNDDIFERWVKRYGWVGIPITVMAPYAEHDAAITLALFYAIDQMFWKEVTFEYWEHKKKFTRVILKMEQRGVKVDVPLCEQKAIEGIAILEELKSIVGGNIGSPIFLKSLLIDKLDLPVVKRSTKTNNASFDKEAMAEYDDLLEQTDSSLAKHILRYRGWQKVTSTNYLPYVNLLSPDGRLRPNYKLHGTRTGRSSCEMPNLQNIPRSSEKEWNGDLKKAFIPKDDDWTLVEFDFSQLELRLATAYARETSLIKIFEEDRDIFTEIAKELDLPRWDTKQGVYATQYGAGVVKLGYMLGDYYKAEKFRDNYQRLYPNFVVQSKKAALLCLQNGRIRLWSGRYKHFSNRREDQHKAWNNIIQAGAADIVEYAMVRLDAELDATECRMLLTIHDSVVFEVRKDREEYYSNVIKKIMEEPPVQFGVKFRVESKEWGK